MLRSQPGGRERVLLTAPRLWSAVLGLSLDQLVAWGVLYYAYTVLSEPIARDLQVSRLWVAGAFSGCLFTAGWVSSRIGPILDVRGTRGSLRAGAIAAPLAFAVVALSDGVPSLVAAFLLLGVVQALALYEPAFRTVVDWCPDERTRSRALLALTSVGGFASTVFLPLTDWLIARHGWRASVLLLALVLALVLLPSRLLLPLPDRAGARAAARPIVVSPSARRLGLGLALHALASSGVLLYLMWHLVEQGESPAGAAAVAGFAGGAQVPGRLLAGPLRRLVESAGSLPVLLLVQAAALLGLVAASGAIVTACVVLFGAASGMMTLERATVLVEWYGPATFGAHQGRLAAVTNAARAASPFVVEAGHLVASYALVFAALALALAMGGWMCWVAGRARAEEQSTRGATSGKL